jgi:phosphatidylserine decarboxylase
MTQPLAASRLAVRGAARLGERAARTLTNELARHHGAKTALVVGVRPDSAVLAAAIDALLPGDLLTMVPADEASTGQLRDHVTAQGRWVSDRVRVVDSLSDADAVDVLVLAEPLTGSADETRSRIDDLAKYLTSGGVLSVAVPAAPGATTGAAVELDRQGALFGVAVDLVLRNRPPLWIYRLRFTPADATVATRLAPAHRPSSVPLTRTMHIDSSGVAAAAIALTLAAATRAARRGSRLWLLPALAAPPLAAFFRDPEREVPDDESAVVAASDGRVLSVERLRDERFGDGEFLRIAVFLSVLDVHVNRSPVAGKVVDYFVADGGFAAAMTPLAEHNVAAYTVLDTPLGIVVVAQRTGLIARRIVQRAPLGALLAKGERIGLIRFGSRTDVYLPADAVEPLVAPGDKVIGGASVIARWR